MSVKDAGVVVDCKGKGNITGFDCYNENMTPVPEKTFNVIPEFSLIQKL